MSVEEDVASFSTQIQDSVSKASPDVHLAGEPGEDWNINPEEFIDALKDLVDSYRKALNFVDELGGQVGLHPVRDVDIPVSECINGELIKEKADSEKVSFALIIIPITRWYVGAHISSRIKSITRNRKLIMERFKIPYRPGGNTLINLNSSLDELDKINYLLFNRERLIRLLWIVLILLFFLSPYILGRDIDLISLTGIKEHISELVEKVQNLIKSSDSGRIVIILSIISIPGYIFLVSLFFIFIKSGFNPKRAIFSGGTYYEYPRRGEISMRVWVEFPSRNIYHLEQRVFRLLNTNKPTECPLDLILNLPVLIIYSFLIFLFGVMSYGSLDLFGSIWVVVIYLFMLASLTCFFLILLLRGYLLRRRDGNL